MYRSCLFLCLSLLLFASPCFAHKSGELHYKDFSNIFNGFESNEFKSFSQDILSKGIDDTLPQAFRDNIGKIPGGDHRLLGHSWTLNDSIPQRVLNLLEESYPGRKNDIISVWREFAGGINESAVKFTGLPDAQASSFASLLYDIHLLGDLEPDNKMLEWVLSPKEIVNNINKHAETLFKNKPQYSNTIKAHLEKVLRQTKGKDAKLVSQALMDELYRLHLGDMLNDTWGKTLKLKFSPEKALKAEKNLAQRILKRIPGIETNIDLIDLEQTEKALTKKSFSNTKSDEVKVCPGLITSDGRLLLAIKEGAETAILIIAIDGGIASYQYLKGDILKPEFQEKMVDAAIKGAAVGTAVGVAVFLGATPGGFIVMGVSIGIYYLADECVALWRENQEKKYLTINDLSAYGINLDTILDLPKEDIFSTSIDSTLNLEIDSTLDLKEEGTPFL